MLEKIKHNKLKNPGIIYEVLVKKMIQQAIDHQKPVAYQIFNNFFNKNRTLGKELQLYNILSTSRYQNQSKAIALFQQTLQLKMRIDDQRLQKQKYYCIKQIKKHYDVKQLFESKIENYKVYAGIYKVFESLKRKHYDPKSIVQSKYTVLEYMLKPLRQQQTDQDLQMFKSQAPHIKQKILQVYVDKFNQTYQVLNQKQKLLLNKFAYSVANNDALNEFISQQIKTIKETLQDNKTQEVTQLLQNIDNIANIPNMQDKIYSMLNLYEIEKINNGQQCS